MVNCILPLWEHIYLSQYGGCWTLIFRRRKLDMVMWYDVLSHAKSLQSCPTLCDPMDKSTRYLCPWNSPGKNTGGSCYALLQGIFPTQGLNSCLLHWQVESLSSEPPGKQALRRVYVCVCLITQLCLTLCNPWTATCQAPLSMGILQARILEWVTVLSCRGSSQPRDQSQILYHLSHQSDWI